MKGNRYMHFFMRNLFISNQGLKQLSPQITPKLSNFFFNITFFAIFLYKTYLTLLEANLVGEFGHEFENVLL